MWHRTGDKQAGITLVCIGFAPSIKARPSNPEIPTCLAYITDFVGMLQDPKFTLYLSLNCTYLQLIAARAGVRP